MSADALKLLEAIKGAVIRVAISYAEAANESCGADHMIYGGISDAFNELAAHLDQIAKEAQ